MSGRTDPGEPARTIRASRSFDPPESRTAEGPAEAPRTIHARREFAAAPRPDPARDRRPPSRPPSRPSRRRRYWRRRAVVLAVVAVVLIGVVSIFTRSGAKPTRATRLPGLVDDLSQLSPLRRQIVEHVEGQLGYRTDPASSYCNKFSGYWFSGSTTCPGSDRSEEWCADFAAWAWQQSGASVTYAYVRGDLNSSAASFYEWGEATGNWHPAGSGYVPQPGDVAVYGLKATQAYAAHVAVVVGFSHGERGPNAVNGDGDRTGHSVVEEENDEALADTGGGGSRLSGYVSPIAA